MQKHISPAGTAPSTNIFQNPIMHIHSQHPYLLGFDSNLVPNPHILVFQPYPGEDSEYSEQSGRFAYNAAPSLGNTPNNEENRLDWCYFSEDTAGSIANNEYVKYSPYSDRKTRKIGRFYIFVFSVHYRYRIHRVFATFCLKNPSNRESLHFFLGVTTAIEYIDYSTDLGSLNRISGLIIKRSFEMAKIAIPAQEFSKKSEKSL